MVQRLYLIEIVDGITQQQCCRLRNAKGLVAEPLVVRADQSHDVSAGREAHQGVVLALDTELLCIFSQILHGIGNVVQRRVVGSIQERTIPQHEHRIAQIVQLVRDGCALVQLCRGVASVAGHHDHIFGVFRFCREIKHLHHAQRRVCLDLFRCIHLPCDLHALVVVLDHKVHALGGILRGCPAHIALDRRVVVFCAALDPLVAVGVKARTLDAGVFPQLLHRGLLCDVRLSKLCCKSRK